MKFEEICADCGFVANHLTMLKRYGNKSIKPCFDVSTFHIGICDICGQKKHVTELRDFFYPTERACKLIRQYVTKGKDDSKSSGLEDISEPHANTRPVVN